MEEESKFKKYLYNQISLGIAIAGAVFWILSYINNPVNQVKLDIALIQKDIQVISNEHVKYTQSADDRDKAIVSLEKKLDEVIIILKTKNVIK